MGLHLLAISKRQLALMETGKEPYDLDVSFQDTFEFLKRLWSFQTSKSCRT